MSTAIVMPQLGLTMEEGTVSVWLKKPGDAVKKDEPLFSVATDKVEMDVESSVDGTLGEILIPVGETVRVGTVLAHVIAAGEAATTATKVPAAKDRDEDNKVAKGSEEKSQGRARAARSTTVVEKRPEPLPGRQTAASPRARRLAKELGVDLAAVRGSAPGGQITEQDIRSAGAPKNKASQQNKSRRQLIADRLTRSIQTTPTFSVSAEANAENLLALYETFKNATNGASGTKLTITDLLLTAYARVLNESPEINTTWEDDGRVRSSVDLGLAVATTSGVVAPVIRKVEGMDLPTLAAKRSELVEKTRLGRLALPDLEGGVGTLSNLGMYRVDHFQALISPGQSSILAVGQIRKRPWVEESLTFKPTAILNLTVDHRVADGAAAAALLGKLIEAIENPRDLTRKPASASGDGPGQGSNV
jgi:pyruvate dehydrogenase E2 component (dihydrolipoamide acetyltransferase)